MVRSEDSDRGIRAVLHGDLNLGWFQEKESTVRGMYAVELDVSGRDVSVGAMY